MSQGPHPETPERDTLFVYANSVSVAAGVYDIQLDFGVEINQERVPTARIAMSPQHAKSLQLLLKRVMEDYEANVGRIPLPAALEAHLRDGSVKVEPEDPEQPS